MSASQLAHAEILEDLGYLAIEAADSVAGSEFLSPMYASIVTARL